MTANLGKFLKERKTQLHQVGTLRELVMAHQAHQRAVNEFGAALGLNLDSLNVAQATAVFALCSETDPREVSDETLIDLMTQLEELKGP